ncbi:hypothetical protein CLOSTASPAR_06266 [[Clostridium] asparagiforme DSM 15981]|uniref:DUF2809 domain-containing protein n=2 Tax=Enterocloster asparagiformis TaxID=333367 RepID=C0DAG2_9FIRM|nr:hypothetical protein CLOSTASPAR_06266 [[Clostridium] asparagiforme DSM 15981]
MGRWRGPAPTPTREEVMEKATNNQLRLRYALAFLTLFALEAFIALRVRDRFVRPYLGDVMVVWVVYCFVRAVRPRGWKRLPLYVFWFAALVEWLQFLNLSDLPVFAGNPIARVVLGSVFDWADILCYGTGCLVLALAEQWAGKRRT